MKRLPTILAAGLNKARKHPVAILVCVALLVAAADLALMAAHRFRETAHPARLAHALGSLHLDAAGASGPNHPFPAEASGSMHVVKWRSLLPRWSTFTLPFGAEEGSRTASVNISPALPASKDSGQIRPLRANFHSSTIVSGRVAIHAWT